MKDQDKNRNRPHQKYKLNWEIFNTNSKVKQEQATSSTSKEKSILDLMNERN